MTARQSSGARVDPRVGGGALFAAYAGVIRQGRSPRGRGSPQGSKLASGHNGRSPRGRGSRRAFRLDKPVCGSIPAWAGEPAASAGAGRLTGVDPRVGGGASRTTDLTAPRAGRSPRGRGSRGIGGCRLDHRGSIPAWAGEPRGGNAVTAVFGVDPRVGGGASGTSQGLLEIAGRSPRGRGSPSRGGKTKATAGSIPAWAGEPRMGTRASCSTRVDPRVGGGAAHPARIDLPSNGRSPRGRGSRRGVEVTRHLRGSIPAWAGEPSAATVPPRCAGVDPRVGGGAGASRSPMAVRKGRSPRGRGSRVGGLARLR